MTPHRRRFQRGCMTSGRERMQLKCLTVSGGGTIELCHAQHLPQNTLPTRPRRLPNKSTYPLPARFEPGTPASQLQAFGHFVTAQTPPSPVTGTVSGCTAGVTAVKPPSPTQHKFGSHHCLKKEYSFLVSLLPLLPLLHFPT